MSDFYDSPAWQRLRYQIILQHGAHCQCCGHGATPGNPIQVDHIKPRSKYPELELDPNNLQVLCADCNKGKGAWDETDWRPDPDLVRRQDEMAALFEDMIQMTGGR